MSEAAPCVVSKIKFAVYALRFRLRKKTAKSPRFLSNCEKHCTSTLNKCVRLLPPTHSLLNVAAETGFQCLSTRMTGRMIQAQQRSCYAVFLFNMSGGRAPTFPHLRAVVSKTRSYRNDGFSYGFLGRGVSAFEGFSRGLSVLPFKTRTPQNSLHSKGYLIC